VFQSFKNLAVTVRIRTMFGCEKSLIRKEGSLAYIAMLKTGKKICIIH
jgi:hypothetical protein